MLNIKIGEQKPINYTIKIKETGLPVNLVGSTILFQLKETENQVSNFLLEKSITENTGINDVGKIFDAQNGKFCIFFKSQDTQNLNINKQYYYTIWRISGTTKEVISANTVNVEEFNVYPA